MRTTRHPSQVIDSPDATSAKTVPAPANHTRLLDPRGCLARRARRFVTPTGTEPEADALSARLALQVWLSRGVVRFLPKC